MTVTEIRNILEAPYDRKVWKNFLQTQFTNNKLNAEDRKIALSDNTLSNQCVSLGNYEINQYTKIGIFEVELNDKVNISRNRVALGNLLKWLTQQVSGAMVVFVQGNKWRFSYISKRKVKNKDTNEIEDKKTAPKRYTYLFGKGEKALTAAQRFDNLIQKQKDNLFDLLSLDDFEEAFSVEKLSKEFFANYKTAYEDFVQFLTGKRYAKKGNKYVEQVVGESNWQLTALFGKDEKQARDFVKRMMGRLVFLYFIQKKGWLSVKQGKKWGEGNPDYLYDLFKTSKQKDDFYARELVSLFFNRLNNEDSENKARDERFPYLNGGLFDDTQDKRYNKLYLPEEVFARMFDTFNNYNFTIYEDAPDEHTIAVDPEMLGHIFENLLEDNKDKGAFYTPKEIVHYMCKEGLKAYLVAQDEKLFSDELAKSTLDKIIQQQELSNDEKQFAEKNAYKIIDNLEQVKICDPAIGSGAFPMGLLQEIFNAQIYLQELKGFKKAKTDADIKKHIIEESIYGVDIDAGAVDIARLRFWLSLVVDEPEPQPLPNLDFKIVCANTLIPLGEINGLDMEAKASLAVKELEKIRDDFFSSSHDNKLQLERQFKKVQTDLLDLRELATNDNYQFYTKLYEFSPFDYESLPCSWFDPWWMFGVKDGFDIVIGNPPYVDIKALKNDFVKTLFKLYPTAINRINLYSIFIERGYSLLNNKGTLAFIVPNSLLINDSYAKIRKHIVKDLQQVIKLPDSIFENAIVETIIMLVNKGSQTETVKSLFFKNNDTTNLTDLQFDIREKQTWENDELCKFNIFKDSIETNILNLIEENKVELVEEVNFSLGITPYDKAKGHTKQQIENRVFHSNQKESSEYVPLIGGKNIRKFNIELKFEEYLKYGKWLGAPRDSRFFTSPKIVVRQILDGTNLSIIAGYTEEEIYFTQIGFSIIAKEKSELNLKYILVLLNSKTISFYHKFKFLDTEKNVFPKILIANCKKFPIQKIKSDLQLPFIALVDYLLFLYDKENEQVISHTTNERLAKHIEDVLNMMVYELYFEEHMKTEGIDVLQFILPKPIAELKSDSEKAGIIKDFYLWYQKPENPVRQRMLLVETRSKDVIAVINKSIQ